MGDWSNPLASNAVGPLGSRVREANRALIAEGDLDAVEDFFTRDHVTHVTDRDMTGGHDTIRSYLEMLRGAFSDLAVDVDVLLESGDRVAWQRTLTGTQGGSYGGFPATGRPIVWRDMAVSRFEGGLIAEEWMVTDLAEQLLRARKARVS